MKKSEKVSGYIIYYDTFDSFDLFEIAIKKEFQNKGLGNELLEKTIDRLFNEEKYEQARRAFESALTLAPDSEDTLFNLRDTYTMLGQKKLAKKCTKIINRLALSNPNTIVQKRNES